MFGPFSKKYQTINHKKWEDMIDDEVDYIWRHNQAGGSILTRGIFTILVVGISVASILLNWADTSLVIIFGVITLAPLVMMFYYDIDERKEGLRMGRLEKIEAVERIRAIRQENSPI